MGNKDPCRAHVPNIPSLSLTPLFYFYPTITMGFFFGRRNRNNSKQAKAVPTCCVPAQPCGFCLDTPTTAHQSLTKTFMSRSLRAVAPSLANIKRAYTCCEGCRTAAMEDIATWNDAAALCELQTELTVLQSYTIPDLCVRLEVIRETCHNRTEETDCKYGKLMDVGQVIGVVQCVNTQLSEKELTASTNRAGSAERRVELFGFQTSKNVFHMKK